MRKNLDWQEQSACLTELTPDHWFSDDAEERRMALEVCKGCPVLSLCREWAITDWPDTPGYWVVGGMTKTKLTRLRNKQGIPTPTALRLLAQPKPPKPPSRKRINKPCILEGCERSRYYANYCNSHYRQGYGQKKLQDRPKTYSQSGSPTEHFTYRDSPAT